MIFSLAQDFHDAVAAIPREHPKHRMLELLEEAVRRDIHFIARHPTTLFQCMWNTCWWYDCPEAEKHYEEPEGGWKEPPPWHVPGKKLHRHLAEWREAVAAEQRGYLWVRNHRPPLVTLGAGQVAEFRAADALFSTVTRRLLGMDLLNTMEMDVRCIDIESGQELYRRRLQNFFFRLATVTPDGRSIVGARPFESTLTVIDFDTLDERLRLPGHSHATFALSVSSDSEWAACGYEEGSIRVWSLRNGAEVNCFRGHERTVTCLCFLPDNQCLLGGCIDGSLAVWEWRTGQRRFKVQLDRHEARVEPFCGVDLRGCIRLFGNRDSFGSVAASPDGTTVVGGLFDGSLLVCDARDGQRRALIAAHKGPVTCVVFLPDNRKVVTGSKDDTVAVWDLRTVQRVRHFSGHTAGITSLAVLQDGRRVVSGSWNGTVRILRTEGAGEQLVLRNSNETISALACSPDGKRLLMDSDRAPLQLWDATTGLLIGRFNVSDIEGSTCSIAYSPDGTRIATEDHMPFAAQFVIRIWDAATGVEMNTFRVPTPRGAYAPEACRVRFASDGKRILHYAGAGQINVWDAATGMLLNSERISDTGRTDDDRMAASDWRLDSGDAESIFRPRSASAPVGWFPLPFRKVVSYPDAVTWAGVFGQDYLCIVTLEGREEP